MFKCNAKSKKIEKTNSSQKGIVQSTARNLFSDKISGKDVTTTLNDGTVMLDKNSVTDTSPDTTNDLPSSYTSQESCSHG